MAFTSPVEHGVSHVAFVDVDGFEAGEHTFKWHGLDDFNNVVNSGAYLYQIQTGEHLLTRKLMLLK